MTEKELYGLARSLARVFKIYQGQQTLEGKKRWLTNLKAYSFSFQEACNSFYKDNQSTTYWLKFLNKKQNNYIKRGNP